MKTKSTLVVSLFALMRLVVCQSAAAQTDSIQQLQQLRIPGGFTLKYEAVEKDVSSPEVRAATLKSVRASYETMVKKGTINQQVAIKQVEAVASSLHKQLRPRKYTVTLSGKNNALLYWRQGKSKSDNSILIYDGKRTFRCLNKAKIAEVVPGFPSYLMAPCPIPAVGVPFISLIKSPSCEDTTTDGVQTFHGDIAWLEAVNADLRYSPGSIQAVMHNGKIKVLNAKTVFNDRVTTRWDFKDHQLFKGLWVASRMRWTAYQLGFPKTACEFKLRKASAVPLRDDQFSVVNWLAPETHVTLRTGRSDVAFLYDPRRGDLETQAERQRLILESSNARLNRGDIAGRSNSGTFLLIALAFAAAGALLWKRQKAFRM